MNHNQQTEELVRAVKNLRKVLEKRAEYGDFQMVMDFLFAGNAEIQTDSNGQLMVYTGYTYSQIPSYNVMTLDTDEYGFSQFWCTNDE